jgi:hypothetical protein
MNIVQLNITYYSKTLKAGVKMTDNEKSAYDHYVVLCVSFGLPPTSFEGWNALIKGEVPTELQ